MGVVVAKELDSVMGKVSPRLDSAVENVIVLLGELEKSCEVADKRVTALEKKARKIEAKYRALKKTFEPPDDAA